MLYLLSREIEYTIGELYFIAKEGGWVFLPRYIQHSFKVLIEKAEVIIHLSLGGFKDFLLKCQNQLKKWLFHTDLKVLQMYKKMQKRPPDLE
jgi:hypothetical protein